MGEGAAEMAACGWCSAAWSRAGLAPVRASAARVGRQLLVARGMARWFCVSACPGSSPEWGGGLSAGVPGRCRVRAATLPTCIVVCV